VIVSALVKRYEDADEREVPVGWQRRDVSYALDIDEQGRLLSVPQLKTTAGKKQIKRTLLLPAEPSGRTSGLKAAFLCDNGSYMLGLDDKRGTEKFEKARELHINALSNMNTPASKAIRAFFNAVTPPRITEFIDEDVAAAETFVFQVNGKFVDFHDKEARHAWDEWYAKDDGTMDPALCLVTGQRGAPEATHGKIGLRGGQMSGSCLISVNADSFASYGKTSKDPAADIGRYAAFAYVTALKSLLKNEKHHRSIGGDTLVYWAEKDGEAEEALFGNLLAPPKADEDSELAALVDKIAKGSPTTDYRFRRKFYLLCLSPNASRISVRFFFEGAFGDLICHIKAHYERLEIVGDGRTAFRLLPLWLILGETTVKKTANDASPLLGGQLLRSILTGANYPLTLYHAILTRIRAGEAVNQAKAAVTKAVLLKNFNEREVTTVALNENSANKPYVLGRLFSVLERLQKKANGSATIRDRYFTSACANPGSVFPTLLNLSMHHAAKLDNAVFFEKLKGELMMRLDDESPFPAAFSLDDQGRFILGYYHQTQSFFAKKEKEEDSADEQ